MHAQQFVEAKEMLALEGLPVPKARVVSTNVVFSFVDDPRRVSLGLGVRLVGSDADIRHSLLHELLHILVYRYPPTDEVRRAFGEPQEWEAPQRFLNVVGSKAGHVTRYASTHPEEDLVETAVFILEGFEDPEDYDECVQFKVMAVESWFEAMRQRKGRRR